MAHKLVAPLPEGHQHFGANVVDAGVGQNGQWNLIAVKQLQNAPNAHAVSKIPVGKAAVERGRRQRGEVRPWIAAKLKCLDVEREINRQFGAIGPAVSRPGRQRRKGVTVEFVVEFFHGVLGLMERMDCMTSATGRTSAYLAAMSNRFTAWLVALRSYTHSMGTVQRKL